ncbi:putative phosphatase regulatory subunit-domain-containing protein [Roridomyces roridus]|uniref:Phosphatase regulatory subunit-domain-containing protein n=1 Tax=Roridomyces roridus TaxID=1738132 RepID=A0AAD7FCB1_9AGAR|nr:putative phosphatase regulatory subunit-domain-containing protein [Roridomyces roridus]
MLATLSMSPSLDFRDSNSASSPLPLLPRRSPSASRSVPTTPPKPSPIKLVVQGATPPEDPPETESSSSSSSSSSGRPTIRPKRVRGVRSPERSAPPPVFLGRQGSEPDDTAATPRPLVYAPASGHLRALSTSRIPSASSPPKDNETPRVIRKKSGEPIKSSLKSSRPKIRGSLTVVLGGPGSISKSEPNTPTITRSRVHFDAQLEHVKLFLAEQKPLAVSRDGSPTDDTSGTDGDFPDWIFGKGTNPKGRLDMRVDVPPAVGEVDVKLRTLTLNEDETAVVGTVAVRNLAFEKWVAVRFTFDGWQTTSEVTARHSSSLPGGEVDLFSFTIRLNDLLARIEGKEMLLAVRFTSAGREMWDNNGGGNYRATFRRAPREEEKKKGEAAEDLHSRLERVVKVQDETADKFKAGGSLAKRYDFGVAARMPWRPSATVQHHTRAQSHPVIDNPSPPSMVPWPPQRNSVKAKPPLGSPRDTGEDLSFRPAPYVPSDDSDEAPFALPQQRHHQRGYFDVPLRERDFGSLRRTPPGTPRMFRALDDSMATTPMGTPGGGRFNSFPPLEPARVGLGLGIGPIGFDLDGRLLKPGSSELSTPAFSSSGTSPVSPLDFEDFGQMSPVPGSASPKTYHNFLDRFCFYTGPEIQGLPRTQSVSSVEELLSAASTSPRLQSLAQQQQNPQSQTFDGWRSSGSSGESTPIASRSETPVAA